MTCESTNGFIAGAAERGSAALTTASAADDGAANTRDCRARLLAVVFGCERIPPGSLVAGKASSICATLVAVSSADSMRLGNRFGTDVRASVAEGVVPEYMVSAAPISKPCCKLAQTNMVARKNGRIDIWGSSSARKSLRKPRSCDNRQNRVEALRESGRSFTIVSPATTECTPPGSYRRSSYPRLNQQETMKCRSLGTP